MSNIPLTGRPTFRPSMGEARSQVTARVYERSTAAEAVNPDLMGLVTGLQSLNPELQKLGNDYLASQREAAVEQARMADAQATDDPRDVLTGAPVEVPATVPPAFDEVYRGAYRNLRTQRAALSISQDILGEYEQQKNNPDFDPRAFMLQRRQEALGGLKDPTQVSILDTHLTQLEQRVSNDYRNLLLKRHEQERKTTMFSMVEQAIDPLMEPEHIAERGHWLLSQAQGIQVMPDEAGRALVRRLRSIAGDRPELFDAFDLPDANGLTLRAKFPELSEEIDVGRRQAEAARDKAINEATEVDRFESMVFWNTKADEDPVWVLSDDGMEALRSAVGPNGFTANQAASIIEAARNQIGRMAVGSEAEEAARSGLLGRYEPEVQQKELEKILAPALDSAWALAAGQGEVDPQARSRAITGLAVQILEARERTGATEPVRALSRLLNRAVSAMPNPEGPDPSFLAASELYRAMEPNSQYRDLHFNEKAQDLLRTYISLTQDQGLTPEEAYKQAYFIHSPENVERMKARLSDPEFLTQVRETAVKAATGSTMFRLWGLVGAGRPVNGDVVSAWAASKATEVYKQNPHLTPEEVLKKVESLVGKSFVVDGTSQRAIQIPQGVNADAAQVAITDFTSTMAERFRRKNVLGPDGYVALAKVPGGNDLYQVKLEDGSGPSRVVAEVRLGKVIDDYRARKLLTKDEAIRLSEARNAVEAGQLVDLDPALIEKGVQAGMITRSTVSKMNELRRKSTFDRFQSNTAFDLGRPSGNNTMKPKVDRKATMDQAMAFAYGSGLNPANHMDLAASLVTVREGVVLSAYRDPAKGAGNNVGAGYNLQANRERAASDLQAVGVPASRVQDVIEGRAALTSDQAKALTLLTLKRMEPEVVRVAESVRPGLWKSLTPQQRAVMLDIAYQTGNPGSYKKAWAALAAGDGAAFKQEVRTFFTNQKGERVEDVRAMDLRASLLNGPSSWKARLMVASR
ncbi:MAG: hypothetical protein ACK4K3_07425 [Aquabacterium sp.]